MTATSDELRVAVAGIDPRQRAALAHRFTTTAQVADRSDHPIGLFWSALAALVREVDANERARSAAQR